MAPQVLTGNYDERCDLWSVGIVSYLLLSGKQPFWGPDRRMPWRERRKIMIDLIERCEYAPMTGWVWEAISEPAKDFVGSLLQMDPDERPSAADALRSPWTTIAGRGEMVSDDFSKEKIERIASLRRRLWQLLVTGLSEEEIEGLSAYIEAQDEEGSCHVTIMELQKILLDVCDTAECCKREDVGTAFEGAEEDDTKLNYVDFMIEVLAGKERATVEKLAKTLDGLDVNGERRVLEDDIRPVLEDALPSDVVDDLWNDVSVDDEGMVDNSEVLSNITKKFATRRRDSIRSGCCRC